eukprot:scaffold3354_cov369-Prasinococcus_capsulatus_cf.AAC.5
MCKSTRRASLHRPRPEALTRPSAMDLEKREAFLLKKNRDIENRATRHLGAADEALRHQEEKLGTPIQPLIELGRRPCKAHAPDTRRTCHGYGGRPASSKASKQGSCAPSMPSQDRSRPQSLSNPTPVRLDGSLNPGGRHRSITGETPAGRRSPCRTEVPARRSGAAQVKGVSQDWDESQCASLRAENKRLQEQKAELLHAFKKQAKLVEALSKQNLHMAAMRHVALNEGEIVKALEVLDDPEQQ